MGQTIVNMYLEKLFWNGSLMNQENFSRLFHINSSWCNYSSVRTRPSRAFRRLSIPFLIPLCHLLRIHLASAKGFWQWKWVIKWKSSWQSAFSSLQSVAASRSACHSIKLLIVAAPQDAQEPLIQIKWHKYRAERTESETENGIASGQVEELVMAAIASLGRPPRSVFSDFYTPRPP